MLDSKSEIIELCDFESFDSEKEMEKKNKNDKLSLVFIIPNLDGLVSLPKILHSEDILPLHHLEIISPPPEW